MKGTAGLLHHHRVLPWLSTWQSPSVGRVKALLGAPAVGTIRANPAYRNAIVSRDERTVAVIPEFSGLPVFLDRLEKYSSGWDSCFRSPSSSRLIHYPGSDAERG